MPQLIISSSYTLGLFFILIVAIIWAGASVLVQHIYQDMDFSSPFFITYLENSLFIIYLPMYQLYTMWENRNKKQNNKSGYINIKNPDNDVTINRLYEYNDEVIMHKGLECDDINDSCSIADTNNNAISIDGTSDDNSIVSKPTYTHLEVFKIAAVIAPFWFLSNCLYYYSLEWTSVSSSTIISNLAGSFTLALSWSAGLEGVTYGKLFGILVSFIGALCVALQDTSSDNDDHSKHQDHALGGDVLALIAAFGYGLYTTAIRYKVPNDEGISMQLLLGYIGLINSVVLLPVVLIMLFLQVDGLNNLTGEILGFLIMNGLCNSVLSDYLWARSVVLTSPTVATIGMSITIPLAMISDLFIQSEIPGGLAILGAILVVIGFGLVNVTKEYEIEILQYFRNRYHRITGI